jgi:4-amino-4-deoxychorismate lyase
MIKVLVNGLPQTHIAVADRGLHYGDGLFETIAVRAGIPQFWERHWQRLARGCRRLGIEEVNPQKLWDEARRVCAGIEQGVLKLIVTRGEGGRGYRPAQRGSATRIVAIYPWPDHPITHWQEGVAVRVCDTRLARNPALAGIKHLNRLEQVLARREWEDPQIAEGLMLDENGHVISGTMSNLFVVKHERLVTPLLEDCGVEGVMRGMIRDLAAELTISYEETVVKLDELWLAEEVFLCNALIGVWPVRRIQQQPYNVGPVTRRLAERLGSLQHSAVGKTD